MESRRQGLSVLGLPALRSGQLFRLPVTPRQLPADHGHGQLLLLGVRDERPAFDVSPRHESVAVVNKWAAAANGGHVVAGLVWRIALRRRGKSSSQHCLARLVVESSAMDVLVLMALVFMSRHLTAAWQSEEKLFVHFLKVAPESAYPNYMMGKFLAARGDHREAAKYFRKVVTLAPRFSEARNLLGMALAATNDLDGALVEFQTALLLSPDAPGFSNVGQLHSIRGELDQAIFYFEKSIAMRPSYALAHSDLGQIYARQGRTDEALAHFDRAMQLDPTLPFCAVNLCQ